MRALSLHVPLLSLWAPLLLLPVSKARRTVEVLCGDFSSISLANDVSKNDMDRVHVLLSHPGMTGATLDLVKGLQYQLTVSSGEVDRIRGLALIVTSDGEAPSPTDLQSPPSPQHPCGLVVTSTARASVDVTPTSSWLFVTSRVPVSQHSSSSTEVLPGVLSSITPTSSAFVQPSPSPSSSPSSSPSPSPAPSPSSSPSSSPLPGSHLETVQPSWSSLGNTLSTAVEAITPYSDTSLLLPVSLKWTADVTTSSTCITVTIVIMINDSAWTQTTTELCKPTGCKEYFTEESGLIASPNFPSQYPDGSRCTYIISPSSSRVIELQFQSFQLEQPYSGKCMDWLTVSNSTSPTERLCGTADVNQLRHMDYVTTGNVLIIQFVTDSKISGNGFQAVYATDIAKNCDSIITDLNGTLSSPRHLATGTYLPNMHCTTTLRVPSSFRIRIYLRRLNFSDPHSGACSEGDFLHFRDLRSDVQTTVTCADPHRDGQLLFESSGSQVEVLFVSDHVTQGEGFELSYAGVPSCQNETYSQYSGAVFSINFPRHYPNMQECFYTINVSEHDNIIELSFPSFFTESDAASDARLRDGRCTRDFVEIFDGEAIHKVCGNWSGKEHLLLFRSRANVLVFRFVSDEQITRPGFYATWQTIKGNNKTCLSTWIDTGHLCFQVMYNPQTWDDGEADCISRGGHLASLLDSNTQRLLNDHILSQTCTDWEAFWIGGSDREWESDFYWTDGSKVVFTNWFPGVPFADGGGLMYGRQPSDDGAADEDCMEMRQRFSYPDKGQKVTSGLYWNDRNCGHKNPYICQVRPNTESSKPVDCDKNFTLDSNTRWVRLQSPGYPGKYPDNTNCTYFVHAPTTAELELEFWDFWLENKNSESPFGCDYDFLELSRSPVPGGSLMSNKLCGDWSGKVKLLHQVVASFYLFLHFTADHSKNYRGFDLTVRLRNGSSGCNETWVRETHGCVRVLEEGADWQTASNRCKQVSASLWQPPAMEDVAAVLTRYLADYPDNKNITVRLGGTAKHDNSCLIATPLHSTFVSNMTFVTEVTSSWTSCDTKLPFVCHKTVQNTSELSPLRYVYINSSEGTLRPRLSADGYNYTNDDATKWILQAPQGHRLLLRLKSVELEVQDECLYDWLLLANTTHQGRICGQRNDTVALTLTNVAEVSFRSDYSITGPAFWLSYQAVNMSVCQMTTFTKSKQNFTSFNFPRPFPDAIDCLIEIHVTSGHRVKMGFDEVHFINREEHSLQVNLGQGWVTGIGDPASTNVVRRQFVSSDNVLQVRFNRSAVLETEGFTGWYEEIPLSIGDPLHLTSAPVWLRGEDVVSVVSVNFPLPYPDNAQQEVIVRAPIGSRVHVSIRHVNLEVTDRLEVDDVSLGESEQAERLLTVCGQEPSENEIESRLNSVRIRLTAGSRTNMKRKRSIQNNGASPLGFNISLKALPDPGYLNKSKTFFNSTFDSCAEKPCLNNGTCTQLSDVRAHCLCLPSYTGLFCQVTWCELSVCEHGDCQTIGADPGFKCQCTLGFWGTRCHMDDVTCRREECNNRGTCIGNASQPVCECDAHETDPLCAPMVTNSITSSKSIGQRLLGEPIWIGLITIFVLLILFGIIGMIRYHCAKRFACCRIQFKSKEQPVESHAPEVQAMATFSKTLPRLTRPAAVTAQSQTVMPTISITKAEEDTAPQSLSPKVPETKVEAAARLFASYREAERTSMSSPGLVDFSTTTDTFIALDSDDTSVGGIVEGQFLPDLSKRGGHESSTSSSLRGLADKSPYREKIRRAHSTGPCPVREDTHSPNHVLARSSPKARSLDDREVASLSPKARSFDDQDAATFTSAQSRQQMKHSTAHDRNLKRRKEMASEQHLFPEVIVYTGRRLEDGNTSETSTAGSPTAASARRRKSLKTQKSVEYDPAEDPIYHMTQASSDPGFSETYSEASLTHFKMDRAGSAVDFTRLGSSREWTSVPFDLASSSKVKTLKHGFPRLSTSALTMDRAESKRAFKHQTTVDSYFKSSRRHRHPDEYRSQSRRDDSERRKSSSGRAHDDVRSQQYLQSSRSHGHEQGRAANGRREKFQRGESTLVTPTYLKKGPNGSRTLRKHSSVDLLNQQVPHMQVRARSEDALETCWCKDCNTHSSHSLHHRSHVSHRHVKARSKDKMSREQRSCDRKARRLAKDRESLSSLNYWNQSIESNRLSKHSRSWHSEPSERLEHKLTLSKDSSSESDKSSQRWIQHETAKRDQKSQWSVSLQRHHGLDALGSSRSEKEMDFTKKELFMKFFSQEVDLDDTQSNEDPRFFSDSWTNSLESSVSTRKNSLKFIGHSSGDSEDTLQVVAVESSSGGAADGHSREFLTVSEPTPKCNVIVYADNLRSKHRTRSRTVSNHVSPVRSPSSETNDDLPTHDVRAGSRVLASTVSNPNKSVPCAVPDAELSSGSSESVRTKVSETSTHLSVTDTDSALSSAASRQTTPSAPSTLHEEVTTTYPHVGKKYSDSAYQTKESSMDMFDDPRRKGSVTTLRGEDKKVTQRLHQAAVKLFVLQQRVRKGRLSRDSAVSTISEDEATMDNYEDLPVSYYPSFWKTGRRQTLLPEKLSGKTPRHHGITEEEEQETDLDLSVKDLSSAHELLPLSETQGQVLQLEQLSETVEV